MGERLVEFEWWGGTENCTRRCFGNGYRRDYVTRRSVFQVLFIQILLDEWIFLLEPTSALDPESSAMVENFLVQEIKAADRELKALIWITHSEEQARRVGTRFLVFAGGKCEEVPPT